MTPLPLTADQVRTLQETGSVETWTALNDPGPHLGYMIGARREYAVRCGEDYPDDASDRVPVPFPIGARAWVQEEWCEYARLLPSDDHGKIHYHADDSHEAVKPWGDFGWQPASDMPQWASRYTVTSTAVRTERREEVWGFVTTWRRA